MGVLFQHVEDGLPNPTEVGPYDTTGVGLLVISISNTNAAGLSVSDSYGNTWTFLPTSGGSRPNTLVYCENPTVGPGHTITVSRSSGVQLNARIGVLGATKYTFHSAKAATGGTLDPCRPGEVTPSINGSLVVTGVCATTSSFAVADPPGFTASVADYQSPLVGGGIASMVQDTAAPVDVLWTFSVNPWGSSVAVFSPVAAPVVEGDIEQTLPAFNQEGSGQTLIKGSGVQILPSLTQTAHGSVTVSGTTSQTLPAFNQEGSGQALGSVSGTTSQTLPILFQSATGQVLVSGSGSQTLPSLSQSGSAQIRRPTMPTNLEKFHNPSWLVLPYNNNRTAWRSIGFPAILVVPDRRNPAGVPVADSAVFNVRVQIEDVPRRARVAGHDHVGIFFPDRELFTKTLSSMEMAERLIDLTGLNFYTAAGNRISREDAQNGDYFEYTSFSGIRERIEYLNTADYYDLSDVLIETETLPPDRYVFSYNADYYLRNTIGPDDQLLCIDSSRTATAVRRLEINHPGEVLEDFYRHTPEVYLEDVNRSTDRTIDFYRPFTDLLQNVFDEQSFLEHLNHVDSILPQYIPYLTYLLGLDIPYFPQSLDNLRRTMLQNVVRLSRLKGSKRAIVELFELFGYNILLANLWWSADGKRLIRPGQTLPIEYKDQEITIEQKCQIEPIVSQYAEDGFGQLEVPLLYRPQNAEFVGDFLNSVATADVTLYSYLVEKDSAAYGDLVAITEGMNADPSGYGESVGCQVPTISNDGLVGYSEVEVDGQTGASTTLYITGQAPIVGAGITFDRVRNVISVTFNGHITFISYPVSLDNPDKELFIFAKYNRTDIIVPSILKGLRSNRFDLQLLTKDGEQVPSDVIEFLINFLFKLKAFHSLLHVIRLEVGLTETYEVTDWTVGGDVSQRYDMDAGKLQVPPAILPNLVDGNCNRDPETLGYKPEDIALRNVKLRNLAEEHAAWKALDDRSSDSPPTLLPPTAGDTNRQSCIYNPVGQDRILIEDKVEEDGVVYHPGPGTKVPAAGVITGANQFPVRDVSRGEFSPYGAGGCSSTDTGSFGSFMSQKTAAPTSHCTLDGVTDYAYKGRVADEILYQIRQANNEGYINKPCGLSMGSGVYYLLPNQGTESCRSVLNTQCDSYLGRLMRAYGDPATAIHYSNRIGYLDGQFAMHRPQLDMSGVTLHFPGCRFPMMDKLESDYVSTEWRAKPWDLPYSDPCNPTWLNARLVEHTNGDVLLAYDDAPFTIEANGYPADIPNMSDHAGSSVASDNVVHAVYINQPSGHEAITLDDVCDYGSDEFINVADPLFNSATQCGTGDFVDYAAGYPCSTGFKAVDDVDLGRGVYGDLIAALEVPTDDTDPADELLFFMGSGIKDGMGYRLDCDCGDLGCSGTESQDADCSLDFYVDQDGYRDWHPDKLEIEPVMVLNESVGAYCNTLDGSISTMFELV